MAMIGPTTDHDEIQLWATANNAVPTELLPGIVDHIPSLLGLVLRSSTGTHPERRRISWEDFFSKFDALGLALVYEDGKTGRNELLQIEARSPYRNVKYRLVPADN